jgi:hypothetical protein
MFQLLYFFNIFVSITLTLVSIIIFILNKIIYNFNAYFNYYIYFNIFVSITLTLIDTKILKKYNN